jgi:hypothetical protein
VEGEGLRQFVECNGITLHLVTRLRLSVGAGRTNRCATSCWPSMLVIYCNECKALPSFHNNHAQMDLAWDVHSL